MTIKHLVLAGGGPAGFTVYGALKYLNKNNFFNLSDISSIHACSAGSIIAALILLTDNWDILDDYILKRALEEATRAKGLQPTPPAGNCVVSSRGGRLDTAKTRLSQNSAPTQRMFDMTDGKCSRRHSGHDTVVDSTRIGPTRPCVP